MTQPPGELGSAAAANPADSRQDPAMRSLYKMSRTAGVGLQDYAAINVFAVIGLLTALASVLTLIFPDVEPMLIIPLAAIALSVVAFVQIRRSNGTQTGLALAIGGILVAGALAGTNLYHHYQVGVTEKTNLAELRELVKKFGVAATSGKADEAYTLFDARFQESVKSETFGRTLAFRMQQLFRGTPVKEIELADRIVLENDANGVAQAVGLLVLKADGKSPDGIPYRSEEPIEFRHAPDGWKIRSITNWFAAAAPAKAGAGASASGAPAAPR